MFHLSFEVKVLPLGQSTSRLSASLRIHPLCFIPVLVDILASAITSSTTSEDTGAVLNFKKS